MTPAWILDSFAAVMLAVAAVSAGRLVVVVTDTDFAHLLMAIAMAGMLVPSLTTLPDAAWEVIFGLMTAWFAYAWFACRGSRADSRCAPHLVHSAAMLYMFLARTAPTAGGGSPLTGMGSSPGPALSYPTLAFAFGIVLAGYCVWDLDRLSSTRHGFAGVTMGCRIAMGVTMALMLFLMILFTGCPAGSRARRW